MTIFTEEKPSESKVFERKTDHEPIVIKTALGSYLYPSKGGKLLDGW